MAALLVVVCVASFIQGHVMEETGVWQGNSILGAYSSANPGLLAPAVTDGSKPVEVVFGLFLREVLGFDEKTSQAKFSLVEYQSWADPLLVWSTDDMSFSKLHFPAHYIWRPDIKLFNSVTIAPEVDTDVNVVALPNGTVLYMPPSIRTVTCNQNPTDPDTAYCELMFGSWTYDISMLDITPLNDSGLELMEGNMGTEWVVHRSSVHKNLKLYECCSETFPTLSYHVTIQRRHKHAAAAQHDKRSKDEDFLDLMFT